MGRVAPYGSFDATLPGWRHSIYQRQVGFIYLAVTELILQPMVCRVILATKINPEVSLSRR
jgi:hypothetical protein